MKSRNDGLTPAPPIGFAHRGAPLSRLEHNTLTAFERALQLGARGLETDIALTADGVPVLAHMTPFSRGPSIGSLNRRDLPANVASLAGLYQRCGTDFDLSIDMGQPRAAEAVVRTAQEYGAFDRLWLTYWRIPMLAEWRRRWPSLHLVYPTIPLSPGRPSGAIARLAEIGVDALNVYHPFCFRATVDLAHARGLLVFTWGIKRERALRRVLQRGVDGVFCDNVEEMVRAVYE